MLDPVVDLPRADAQLSGNLIHPGSRVGSLSLAVSVAWDSSLDGRAGRSPRPSVAFETTGSHVPQQSLSQARAPSMPDATWAVRRSLPGSSRGQKQTSVSTPSETFRHFISGSLAFAFLAHT